MFDHAVEMCEHPPCGGDEDDFFGLSGLCEPVCEVLNVRTIPTGREGGEIEHTPDVGSSAPTSSLSAHMSTITGPRSEPGETGKGFVITAPQFRQAGDETGRDCRSDAGHGLEQISPVGHMGCGVDERLYPGFYFDDSSIKQADKALDIRYDIGVTGLLEAAFFSRAGFDQIIPAPCEGVDLTLLGGFWGLRGEAEGLSHLSQHPGVYTVCFGESARGLAEGFGVAGIDRPVGPALGVERLNKRGGVDACGFKDDQSAVRQVESKGLEFGLLHGDALMGVRDGVEDIDPVFGYIDTEVGMCHVQSPGLVIRGDVPASPWQLFRVKETAREPELSRGSHKQPEVGKVSRANSIIHNSNRQGRGAKRRG